MKVSIKSNIWTDYYIREGVTLEDLIELLEGGSEGLYMHDDTIVTYREDVYDTHHDMGINENGGDATIEIQDDEHNIIWTNEKRAGFSRTTLDVKKDIIENFIDWFTSDEKERESMKRAAEDYIIEDEVDEVQQFFSNTPLENI